MPIRRISGRANPYDNRVIGDASFTVGAEGSNIINVAVQLKDINGAALTVRGNVKAYLSSDANGDVIIPYGPNGGVAIGTNGLLSSMAPAPTVTLVKGTLVVDAVTTKFKTTTTATYRINHAQFTKAAATAILFTAAHVVSANKFGIILVQVNAAGTVSTKVPLATQAYTTAALALAALPLPDAGNAALGYITIDALTGSAWTANTNDLTAASGLDGAGFVDIEEPSARAYMLTSSAAGLVDINITETLVKTMYLNVVLPDGTLKTSGAITFA